MNEEIKTGKEGKEARKKGTEKLSDTSRPGWTAIS